MKLGGLFSPRHVFWRRAHFWAVNNFPPFLVPISIFFSSFPFYIGWVPGRIGLIRNLEIVFGRQPIRNLVRGMRVVYNFSWAMTDTWIFTEQKTQVDWEFEGIDQLAALSRHERGAIILTAHMGNYDLGAYFFAEKIGRPLSIVRIPEADDRTERMAQEKRQSASAANLSVTYNTTPDAAAVSLYERLREGEIVAIQGDRSYPGLSTAEITIFDTACSLPAGPFELARAARAPIYPLFVVRSGLHRYRVIVRDPIIVKRSGRDREGDLQEAMAVWGKSLESVLGRWWHQWAAFKEIAS